MRRDDNLWAGTKGAVGWDVVSREILARSAHELRIWISEGLTQADSEA